LHGSREAAEDAEGRGRSGGLQVFFAPPNNGGNNIVAQGLP
jgi:hypothetical protein